MVLVFFVLLEFCFFTLLGEFVFCLKKYKHSTQRRMTIVLLYCRVVFVVHTEIMN